ncbi:glycoside hydrolase TIM-barrel-like domain-containing protein [Candidatus Bipolaricaulota bacterium]
MRSLAGGVVFLGLSVLLGAVTFFAEGQSQSVFDDFVCGLHIGGTWSINGSFDFASLSRDSFDHLIRMNADWVGLNISLMISDSMDATVETCGPNEDIRTFTDEELLELTRKLRSYGFRVYYALSLHNYTQGDDIHAPPGMRYHRVNLGDPYAHEKTDTLYEEYWPWSPDHPDHETYVSTFFRTYTDLATHYAALAEQEGVDLFALGTETPSLFRTRTSGAAWTTEFYDELSSMVAAVRDVYGGLLTYDMLMGRLLPEDWFPEAHSLWGDLDLDVVGLSYYVPLLDQRSSSVPSVAELRQSWQEHFRRILLPLRDVYQEKPIVFLEYGITDGRGSSADPSAMEATLREYADENANGLDDGEEEQEHALEALFQTMAEQPDVLSGLFLWGNSIATNTQWECLDKRQLCGFTVRDRLAEATVEKWYTSWAGHLDMPAVTLVSEQLRADESIRAFESVLWAELPTLIEWEASYEPRYGLTPVGQAHRATESVDERFAEDGWHVASLVGAVDQGELHLGLRFQPGDAPSSDCFVSYTIKLGSGRRLDIRHQGTYVLLYDYGLGTHWYPDARHIRITDSEILLRVPADITSDAFPGGISTPCTVSFSVTYRDGMSCPFIFYGGTGNLTVAPQEPEEITIAGTDILFDEAHRERNTISFDRATELNPDHPEHCLFGHMAEELSASYQLDRATDGVTRDVLEKYRVLIISAPRGGFEDEEVQEVETFVRSGGGLLILGDAGIGAPINELAAPFGIHFLEDGLLRFSSGEEDVPSYVATASDHCVTSGIEVFSGNWGTAIDSSEGTTILLQTSHDAWHDANDDGVLNLGEAEGPFVTGVALEYGEGRIVALSDNAFVDDYWDSVEGNRRLFTNAIDWLAGLCDHPTDEENAVSKEIPGLGYVGNPHLTAFPDGSGMELARAVYDLQAWNGRLYIGAGEREMNAGPVPVISYDPITDQFSEEFVVDEEVILDYVASDDRLYIPGSDATESWDSGNIYVNGGSGWTKHRTLDGAIHVFDAAEFDGLLFAAAMTVTSQDPLLGGGSIYVSEDLGESWERELWLATGVAGVEVYDPARPDVSGFTELFEFKDRLYAYGYGLPHLYVYEEGKGFVFVDVDMFPGVLTSTGVTCESLPATEALLAPPDTTAGEWGRIYEELGICIDGRIHAPVEYGDKLVYVGRSDYIHQNFHSIDEHYLFAATQLKPGMIEQVQMPHPGQAPRDLLVLEDTLYLLTTQESGDTFETGIYRTSDLSNWEEVEAFEFDAPAYSFEHLGGYIYIGFGGEGSGSGCIYRLEAS